MQIPSSLRIYIFTGCEYKHLQMRKLIDEMKNIPLLGEYMPRYGYKHLCTEDDDYKYYLTLNLPCIKHGFMGRHCNYGAPLKDVDV